MFLKSFLFFSETVLNLDSDDNCPLEIFVGLLKQKKVFSVIWFIMLTVVFLVMRFSRGGFELVCKPTLIFVFFFLLKRI